MNAEEDYAVLASAFPTLTQAQLAECVLASSDGTSSLPQLALNHKTGFFTAVARAVLAAAPSTALGVSFPGLRELVDAVVLRGTFTTRTHLALQQLGDGGVYTWGELAALTPDQFGALLHMSERSLSELVGVVARASFLFAQAPGRGSASRGGAPAGTTAPRGPWPGVEPEVVDPERVCAAANTSGSGGNTDPPALVCWNDRISEFEEALGNERDRAIFWASIDVDPPLHVSMAPVFGVSAERVRQLRARAEDAASVALVRTRLAPFQRLADSLGERLGLGFPESAPWAQAAVDWATRVVDAEWRNRIHRLLFWLAGPYHRNEIGWLARGPLPGRANALADAIDDTLRVDLKRVDANLTKAGLVHEAVDDWVVQVAGLRCIAGDLYVWEGSVGDKAFAVLGAWERPATVAELVDAIGEAHVPRSTRGRLLGDPRFKRVDRTRIGLRGWPQDEYTGTVEELARELEARGGNCDIAELVMTVSRRFDLTLGSVQAHTRAPRFVVEGTRARFRRPDERYQPRHGLTEGSRCYLLGDLQCSYRLVVDSQAVRGSSRWIPDGLGAWLGVFPGVQRNFFDGADVVRVSWCENSIAGPLLGSVRQIVARLGASQGDQLVLRFNRERCSVTASLVKPRELAAKTPEEQVEALTGLSINGAIEDALAEAVGVATSGLENHLRSRREYDLLAVISARRASDHWSQLDRF